MTKKQVLRFFLDEGVPRAVGRLLSELGHDVIYLQEATATGSPDQLVCAVAEANNAILVALDSDMKRLANRHGVGQKRYRKLSLLKLSCREPNAAARIAVALSLIDHEWAYSAANKDRRIFIDIGDASISTRR